MASYPYLGVRGDRGCAWLRVPDSERDPVLSKRVDRARPQARLIPPDLRETYEWNEWRNAVAVLNGAHPEEWRQVHRVLRGFSLPRSLIIKRGGNLSDIARGLQVAFDDEGWEPTSFSVDVSVNGEVLSTRTHRVDCFSSRIALEVEWNSKDTSFSRDLDAFRQLYDLRIIDVGVILTRQDALFPIFVDILGAGNKRGQAGSVYGASTSHMSKLLPKLHGGGAGGCPVLAIGIGPRVYRPSE